MKKDVQLHYDENGHPRVYGFTNDIALFTLTSERSGTKPEPPTYTLSILLINRAETDDKGNTNVEAGKWALPGGFIKPEETDYEGAIRELEEETTVSQRYIKHFKNYSVLGRDERGWVISSAFYAIVPENSLEERMANDDAQEVKLFPVEEVWKLDLAFDHAMIIKDALKLVVKDMFSTNIAKNVLPKEFTLSELQHALIAVAEHITILEEDGVDIEEFKRREIRILYTNEFNSKIKKSKYITPALDKDGKEKETTRNSYRPSQLFCYTDYQQPMSIYR